MLLPLQLTKILGPGALLLALSAVSSGCSGCHDATLSCDENGENCVICDGYGCHPAQPGTGSGVGSGGAGQGGGGGSGGGAVACDPAVTTCPCDADDACSDGLQCVEGLCLDGCTFSYECGPDKVCANGQCVVSCDADHPCAQAGTVCDKGVCVVDPANPACDAQNPCPGAGEICVGGLCATPCQVNVDCPEGEVCNASTGACMSDPSPQPGCGSTPCSGIGQQCMADGYCHYPCGDLMTCQLIDNRFVACDAGVCKTQEQIAPQCTIDDPCPAGLDCISNKCL